MMDEDECAEQWRCVIDEFSLPQQIRDEFDLELLSVTSNVQQ